METQLRFLVFSREDKVDKEKLNYEKTQSDRRKPNRRTQKGRQKMARMLANKGEKEKQAKIIARY